AVLGGAVDVLAGGAVVAAAGARAVRGARVERGATAATPGAPFPPGVTPPGCAAGARPTAADTSRRPWQLLPHEILAAVSRMRCTAAGTLSPWATSRATAAVTWGVA